MGSLMAGWTSEQSSKGLSRKGSFTRDEIENFWRVRKAQHEEHEAHVANHMETLREVEAPASTTDSEGQADAENSSNPFSADDPENLTDAEKKARVKDWWTKSNWAFLNAPPEVEKNELKGGSYTAQYDVAAKASVGDTFGITAN